MDREELLRYVAPCSLSCYACPALQGGAVEQHAKALCRYFEGYYEFNEQNLPEQHRGWLTELQYFTERLKHYAARPCPGCRQQQGFGGCIAGCVVPACTRGKGVDFCGQCPDFPCRKARDFFMQVNATVAHSWEDGSRRISQVGAEKYFEEIKDRSHYEAYIPQK